MQSRTAAMLAALLLVSVEPAGAQTVYTRLNAGTTLVPGDKVVSPNGAYYAAVTTTGQFCVYQKSGAVVSCGGKGPQKEGKYFAALTTDGETILGEGTGPTAMTRPIVRYYGYRAKPYAPFGAAPGRYGVMQDNGAFVVYQNVGPLMGQVVIWGTGSPAARARTTKTTGQQLAEFGKFMDPRGTIETHNSHVKPIWITIQDLGRTRNLDSGCVSPGTSRGWHSGTYIAPGVYFVRAEVMETADCKGRKYCDTDIQVTMANPSAVMADELRAEFQRGATDVKGKKGVHVELKINAKDQNKCYWDRRTGAMETLFSGATGL